MNKDAVSLTAKYLAMRLETDPQYAARVRDDPESALREAGLPEDVVSGIVAGAQTAQDTTGLCCVDFTCWASECPGSCSLPSANTPTDWGTGCV